MTMDTSTMIFTTFCLCLLVLTTISVTTWFCLRTFQFCYRQENADFRDLVERYRETLKDSATAASNETKILALIEATNLNTKSLDLVEKALNQMVLRYSTGIVDRTNERKTQVGEERIANRTILSRPTPTTTTADGREGFVDATTGKVEPVAPKTPRELAATEPT